MTGRRQAPPLEVRAATEGDAATAVALARRLAAPVGETAPRLDGRAGRDVPRRRLATGGPDASPWTLLIDGERRLLERPDGVRLEIDFTGGRTAARQHESGRARQPLARALGVTRLRRRLGRAPRLLDATGGLGRDAWFAASLGCPVVLIERSPLVHALLESALARAARESATADTAARIDLVHGEARARLAALAVRAAAERPDVVYLDPMYPPRRRRAAPSKGMQFLHDLLGPDTDNGGLLSAALDAALRQVTVKRPSGAPPLDGDERFDGQRSRIESPGTRYDVYGAARMMAK